MSSSLFLTTILTICVIVSRVSSKTIKIPTDQISDHLVDLHDVSSSILWNQDTLSCDMNIIHHSHFHPNAVFQYDIYHISFDSLFLSQNSSYFDIIPPETTYMACNDTIMLQFRYHTQSKYGDMVHELLFHMNLIVNNQNKIYILNDNEFDVIISRSKSTVIPSYIPILSNNAQTWSGIIIGAISTLFTISMIAFCIKCFFDGHKHYKRAKTDDDEPIHFSDNERNKRDTIRRDSGIVAVEAQQVSRYNSFSNNQDQKVDPFKLKAMVDDNDDSCSKRTPSSNQSIILQNEINSETSLNSVSSKGFHQALAKLPTPGEIEKIGNSNKESFELVVLQDNIIVYPHEELMTPPSMSINGGNGIHFENQSKSGSHCGISSDNTLPSLPCDSGSGDINETKKGICVKTFDKTLDDISEASDISDLERGDLKNEEEMKNMKKIQVDSVTLMETSGDEIDGTLSSSM